MTRKNPIVDLLTGWVLEEGWALSCKFMHEIEGECGCCGMYSIDYLMTSDNLATKWMEFVRRN